MRRNRETHRKRKARTRAENAASVSCRSLSDRDVPFLVLRTRARTFQLTPPSRTEPYMMGIRFARSSSASLIFTKHPSGYLERSYSLQARETFGIRLLGSLYGKVA